jgi:hypothetical protein
MRFFRHIKEFLASIIVGLVEDEKGRFSHSKFWSNIAYGITSWVIIKLTLTGDITVEYFLAYLVTAGGHSAIAKYINARTSGSYQFPSEEPRRPIGSQKPIE